MFKWREVGSVSCVFWAAMLGDQAVNLVGQDSGLTARNQRHGEATAIVQARIARGEMSRRRAIPAGGIHRRAAWNFMNPSKELYLRLVYAMFGRIVPRMKSCSFLPGGDMVPPARSVGHNE